MDFSDEIKWSRLTILHIVLTLACLALAYANLYELFSWKAWWHDYLGYTLGYTSKLISEGRWLNYLFFQQLKLFSPFFMLACKFIAIFYYAYKVSRNYQGSITLSLLLGSAAVQIPSLYSESCGPAYSFIAYLLLMFISYFSDKINQKYIFLISGILFCGCVQQMHFLVFLLYLHEVKDGGWRKFSKLVLWWVATFVIGVVCAQTVVFLITGQFITPGPWRRANYIQSVGSFFDNLSKLQYSLRLYFGIIPKSPLLLAATLITIVVSIYHKLYIELLMCLMTTFSTFTFTFILGISLPIRATLPLWVGLIFAFIISSCKSQRLKWFTSICLFLFALSMFPINYESTKWYRETIDNHIDFLHDHLNLKPYQVKKFVFHTPKSLNHHSMALDNLDSRLNRHFFQTLSVPVRLVPSLRALGYRQEVKRVENQKKMVIKSPTGIDIVPTPEGVVHMYFR